MAANEPTQGPTRSARAIAQGGRELRIEIILRGRYERRGSRAQPEAEALIPANFEWPRDAYIYDIGR
ncbi:MAG TPA: hypothetical protein VN279_11880 [Rhodocyclaceae bacterium]|nr:hypothetical protein [Rhodocyclaceae bacterium]